MPVIKADSPLNHRLMRSQVYEYLREQMRNKGLKPGSFINVNKMIEILGVSRTPLREALFQLQAEGFVNFLPHRGIIINVLTLTEFENMCEIIGGLESRVIISVFDKIGHREIDRMKLNNEKMKNSILNKEFTHILDYNFNFHDTFLKLSTNQKLLNYVIMLKQRLYDFHTFPKNEFVKNWVEKNCLEHQQFIDLIEKGNANRAAEFWRDVHWVTRHPEWFLSEGLNLQEEIESA